MKHISSSFLHISCLFTHGFHFLIFLLLSWHTSSFCFSRSKFNFEWCTLLFFTSLLECLELWGLLQFCFYFLDFFPLVELLVQAPWTGQACGWQPQAERDDTGDSPPVLDRPVKLALSTWGKGFPIWGSQGSPGVSRSSFTHTHKGPAQPNCNPLRGQPGSMRSGEPFAS